MRVIRFDRFGGPEVVTPGQAERPLIAPGKVLIETVAFGINRPDCFQRAGHYPPPPGESDIPGLEVSGRIVEIGAGVEGFRIGDEICALVGSGGYADYVLADAGCCLPKPKALDLISAAGVPENFFTVYDNVFNRGRLAKGEQFLVHGGSSGIGSIAIQLAAQFGARVFATAGSPEKCAFCENLGAQAAIDYKQQDFVAQIRKLTDKKGVDVILDMVGGPYFAKNISILAVEGRLVNIAFLQGAIVNDINLTPIMVKRLTVTGSTLRPRSAAQKAIIAHQMREKIWPLLDAGVIKPHIHKIFTMENVRQAHELMESSAHLGKILVVTGK